MSKRRPTLRAQWLGKMLKELREQNGLKLTDSAEYLQRSFSAISKFESGALPIREPEVRALMDLYGVEGERQRAALIQLSREVSKTGWWEKYSDDITDWFVDYVWLESRARHIRAYEVTPVNGLLQTREYAEAWMRAVNPHDSAAQIERGVELRMARQKILRGEKAVELEVLLDEAALRRIVGGRDVMREQLQHLLVCGKQSNIEIRVLPYSAGAHASPDGGFTLLHLEDPFPLVAYTVGVAGGVYLESHEAERVDVLYNRLRESSLSPEESAKLIVELQKEMR
ncbi:helix-turn-helix domain-containing protein [Thermobifida alba]|jgi:transcriptional regulator with XRE-family HTH domain|uniref:HTH cro/C1-type domain-containing protein n=2 Tax=Thermobifida TaxID=83677 RepID=A0A147KFR9_THECS|nr:MULTISPECIES: helix-turn-helix transcriptional regulator [Thermobifida]KUP96135.1 hypothetical protein AC529_13875 [Thermobifida cellulosilytica TB100]UPT21292.1 helix-turn-helix domain-containing protein [Thermobifida alba]HLU98808.1 helix-turn-helix transcriptional regulator [Thermobifida alba]